MLLLLLYFLIGAIASLYVVLRSGTTPTRRVDSIFIIFVVIVAWPLVYTAGWWLPVISPRRER